MRREGSNRIMDKGRGVGRDGGDELVVVWERRRRRMECILYDFLACTIINGNITNRKKKEITRTMGSLIGHCFCTFGQVKVGALLSLDRRKLANKCCFVVIRNYYDGRVGMFNKYTACLLTKRRSFSLYLRDGGRRKGEDILKRMSQQVVVLI